MRVGKVVDVDHPDVRRLESLDTPAGHQAGRTAIDGCGPLRASRQSTSHEGLGLTAALAAVESRRVTTTTSPRSMSSCRSRFRRASSSAAVSASVSGRTNSTGGPWPAFATPRSAPVSSWVCVTMVEVLRQLYGSWYRAALDRPPEDLRIEGAVDVGLVVGVAEHAPTPVPQSAGSESVELQAILNVEEVLRLVHDEDVEGVESRSPSDQGKQVTATVSERSTHEVDYAGGPAGEQHGATRLGCAARGLHGEQCLAGARTAGAEDPGVDLAAAQHVVLVARPGRTKSASRRWTTTTGAARGRSPGGGRDSIFR